VDEARLIQSGHSVGQPDFLGDFPGLEPNSAHAAEPHLAVRGVGKSAYDKIIKGKPGMGAFAHPTEHDHVAVCDKIRYSFKAEIGKSLPKNPS
jgi:hypothetical protein